MENKLNSEKNQILIYRKIMMILRTMAFDNDEYFPDLNFIFLRSQVFINILEFFSELNIVDIQDIKELLMLMAYIFNFSNSEKAMCKDDINIIDKCLDFLIIQLCSGNNIKKNF